jgi:hypothetical protein
MAWWRVSLGDRQRREGAGAPRAPSPGDWQAPPEVRAVLSEQVTFRAPAAVALLDSGRRFDVRFAGLGEREVSFDLPSPFPPPRLEALSACWVSFVHRRRSVAFLSHVRRVDAGTTPELPRQLVLRLPSRLASEDLRSARRIGGLRASGVRVGLDAGRRGRWTPAPVNLSASGILLEFDRTSAPPLHAGSEARVELRLAEESVTLEARVRRRQGPRLALTFRDVLRDGDLAPPPALARILERLESAEGTAAPPLSRGALGD